MVGAILQPRTLSCWVPNPFCWICKSSLRHFVRRHLSRSIVAIRQLLWIWKTLTILGWLVQVCRCLNDHYGGHSKNGPIFAWTQIDGPCWWMLRPLSDAKIPSFGNATPMLEMIVLHSTSPYPRRRIIGCAIRSLLGFIRLLSSRNQARASLYGPELLLMTQSHRAANSWDLSLDDSLAFH